MSAACAENELARKLKAASAVPKIFKFIISSPIRRRGLLLRAAGAVRTAPTSRFTGDTDRVAPRRHFATAARHRNAGMLRTVTRSVRRKKDSVDNRPFPLSMSGKTSKESAESLDVVMHSNVRSNASKRWTGADCSQRANSRPCCSAATGLRAGRQSKPHAERKKPRARARGFRSCCVLAGLEPGENRAGELIVQAGANDVLGEADVVHRRSDGGVEAAEVDVEIFELRRPIAHEGVFDAGADGPAELVAGRRGQGRSASGDGARLDVAVCAARGDIRQPTVEGIADPAAEGGKPGAR